MNPKTFIARLTGRCADGAERDGGRKSHIVMATVENPIVLPMWGKALCGAKPRRLSNGWVEVNDAEASTCPRCIKKARLLESHTTACNNANDASPTELCICRKEKDHD